MEIVRVKASATSANLGAGFDVLGIALCEPYDTIEVEPADRITIEVSGRGADSIPLQPERNTAGLVALEMKKNVHIRIHNNIRPGSGLGSSAAPAAGTAFAINELFSLGYTKEELIRIAARGRSGGCRSGACGQRRAVHHGRPDDREWHTCDERRNARNERRGCTARHHREH